MPEDAPAPQQGGPLAGLPQQAGPLATIATIVIAAFMQQYTANTNHTTTNDDLDKIKSAQSELGSKFTSLSDQLGQITTLKATDTQMDSRLSTAEQGLVQLQADLKRDERKMQLALSKVNTPNPTPYVPIQSATPPQTFEPLPQQTPRHR